MHAWLRLLFHPHWRTRTRLFDMIIRLIVGVVGWVMVGWVRGWVMGVGEGGGCCDGWIVGVGCYSGRVLWNVGVMVSGCYGG